MYPFPKDNLKKYIHVIKYDFFLSLSVSPKEEVNWNTSLVPIAPSRQTQQRQKLAVCRVINTNKETHIQCSLSILNMDTNMCKFPMMLLVEYVLSNTKKNFLPKALQALMVNVLYSS